MKFLFNFLPIFFFSISTCQAELGDELKNQCQENLKTLTSIAVQVNRLKESDYSNYFNSENIDKTIVNKYKKIMRESVSFYNGLYNQLPWTEIKTKEQASSCFLFPYFQVFHIAIGLSEFKSNCLKGSYFDRHLNESIAAYDFFPMHFMSLSKDICQTVKITKNKNTENEIQNYSIHLNLVATFLLQKRRALNLINRMQAINKVKFPAELKRVPLKDNRSYEDALKELINKTIHELRNITEHNILPFSKSAPEINYNIIKGFDVSRTDVSIGRMIPNFLIYNTEILSDAEGLAHDALIAFDDLSISEHASNSRLVHQEIEINKSLVQAMIEEEILKTAQEQLPKIPSAQSKGRTEEKRGKARQQSLLKRQKSVARQKTKGKKKRSLDLQPQQRKEMEQDSILKGIETTNQTVAITEDSSTPDLIPSLKSDELLNDNPLPLYAPDVTSLPELERREKEEGRSGGEKEKEKESEASLANEEIDEDPAASTRAWLQEILHNAHNHFMIQNKAQSLLRELDQNNPYLLLQIQEATSGLALQLQQSKTVSQVNKSLIVPQKLDVAFRYFRDTPMPYLQGTRMGFVTTLLEGLGIQVDKSREGSRVHMSYQKHHLSVHIHDKNNGALDGGRLNSLRKFLLDIGFVLKDEISN